MKKVANVLLATVACALMAAPVMAKDCDVIGEFPFKDATTKKTVCRQPTPDEGLEILKAGNARFVKGKNSNLEKFSDPKYRQQLADKTKYPTQGGQKPFAIVLTCSDSRVPPEVLFDQGLGEIFVVRVAGNIVSGHELGSIDYALEHLHANLIVVLGHERCGAVQSTYGPYPEHVDGVADPKLANIATLTESIYPAVDKKVKELGGKAPDTDAAKQAEQVEECIVENIKEVAVSLEEKSPIVKEAIEKATAKIVRAKYDLDSGVVSVLAE